jgi:hypothetical protein
MTLLDPQKMLVGNDAGWIVSFRDAQDREVLAIGRDTHNAEIDVTLESGLSAGSYQLVVEGLTDDQVIRLTNERDGLRAHLFLYWRDVHGSLLSSLASWVGLTDLLSGPSSDELQKAHVGVFALTSVSRRAGERRYETILEGRELVYHRLETRRIAERFGPVSFPEAMGRLAKAVGIATFLHGVGEKGELLDRVRPEGKEGIETVTEEKGTRYVDAVARWAASIEQATGLHGRGMALLRDGMLHLGKRPIPLDGRPVRDVHLGNGLAEVNERPPVRLDPEGPGDDQEPPRTRRQLQILAKGRPDLKPGDVIRVEAPPSKPEELRLRPSLGAALGGTFAGPLIAEDQPSTLLYVSSVRHRLGRRRGFVTEATGVVIDRAEDAWDRRRPLGVRVALGVVGGGANAALQAARGVRAIAEHAARETRHAEVGEVRASTTRNEKAEPPAHTTTIWRGLEPGDGLPSRARRLATVRADPSPVEGVPYASPFAWGKCGLVLPRYPGMRVVMVHRNGDPDDAVDVGALWESGVGPDAEPGDYWLILPASVAAAQRAAIADDAQPEPPTGPATQDLIDADGNRVIEVGKLTIRIGRNALRSAGERPPVADPPVAIEHESGTRILIRDDGTVVVESASNLELRAKQDIRMKAKNVIAEVEESFDVQ